MASTFTPDTSTFTPDAPSAAAPPQRTFIGAVGEGAVNAGGTILRGIQEIPNLPENVSAATSTAVQGISNFARNPVPYLKAAGEGIYQAAGDAGNYVGKELAADWAAQHPELSSALLNGEEGAGWKALQGGLAGGAVGGGLGLAFNPEAVSKALHFEKKPGLTSALPPDASKSRQIAAHIKSKSPSEQLNEINELQNTAESSMPEIVNYTAHGLNTAAAGGAGAYVAAKGVYDPTAAAENIRARLQTTGKNTVDMNRFNSIFPTPPSAIGPRAPQHLTVDEIRAMLPKSLIPGVTPGLLNTKLQSSLGDAAAKEIIEASKVTGMRNALGKLRPGKLGLLGLLAGGWGVGSGIISNHYRQGDANRNSAKDVLNALVMPDQTANTMQ
jgi:hypothetical protein